MPHEGRSFSRAKSALSPARRAALDVVREARERNAFAHELLDGHFANLRLSEEDRAFATRLVLGVAAAQGTLDEIADRMLDKPTPLEPAVRDCLRLSLYELFFLQKSPHAAVDQGVELVRTVVPKAAGLANFILRRAVKATAAFPFGDPEHDDAALARLHAFPLWLAQLLVAQLGRSEAAHFMEVSGEQAPVFLAVNSLRADDEIPRLLKAMGAREMTLPGCWHLTESRALGDGRIRKALSKGQLLVSDFSAQRIAALGAAGGSVLEIGAGRATKTILLQSAAYRASGRQMKLTALDNHGFKMDILRKRTATYGVELEDAVVGDAERLGKAVGTRSFDTVFIDAPCSGLGTLRRHPELRWRLAPEDIARLSAVQQGMLQSAASHVNPGGCIVYSTCTVVREENQANVKAFLESKAGAAFRLESIDGRAAFAPRLESGSCDAHFAVRMRRVR